MWTVTVPPIRNASAAADRARDLALANLNGMAAALVSLDPPVAPGTAELELHFFNSLHVAAVLAEVGGGTPPAEVFPIRGGHRVPAGLACGDPATPSRVEGQCPAARRLEAPRLAASQRHWGERIEQERV